MRYRQLTTRVVREGALLQGLLLACALISPKIARCDGGEGRGAAPKVPPSVHFHLSTVTAQPGTTFEVPVQVEAETSLSMIALSVEYDNTALEFVEPILSQQIHSMLERKQFADSEFTWFFNQDEGWAQVLLVLDFQARETFSIPPGLLHSVMTLSFRASAGALGDSQEITVPISFTRPESANYQGNFEGADVPVYNISRRHGRPFTAETQFGAPDGEDDDYVLIPDFEDGEVILSIIGDVGIFVRGDANADRVLDISDPINILGVLFAGDGSFLCEDAVDANDDGEIDISDPISVLNYLFTEGTTSQVFSNVPAVDETPDSLGCAYY